MKAFRHVAFLFFLALAIGLGQQASLRHELGHAFQRLDAPEQHQVPAGDSCDKCSAYSALHGGLLASPLDFFLVAAAIAIPAFASTPAPRRTIVATRSRAPPHHS
jgi:hypothetical protein